MALLADNAPVSRAGCLGQGGFHSSLSGWDPPTMESPGFPGKGKQQHHPCGAVGSFICLFVCLKWVRGVWGEELMMGLGKEFPLNLAIFSG